MQLKSFEISFDEAKEDLITCKYRYENALEAYFFTYDKQSKKVTPILYIVDDGDKKEGAAKDGLNIQIELFAMYSHST